MVLLNDLRFTTRQLIRQPAYTAAAVLSLGLAIGATTTTFSVVSGVVLRRLPFPAPSRLVTICERHPSVEGFCIASPPDVEDWRRYTPAFQEIGLARDWSMRLGSGDDAGEVYAGIATGGFFRALGVQPALGRLITDDEYGAARRVVVLSDELWRTRFGADRAVLGRTVLLDGAPAMVVGVLPAGLRVPHLEDIRLWASLPFDPHDEDNRHWRGFITVARLAPGVSRAAATAQLTAVAHRLAAAHPATNRGWGVEIVDLRDSLVGEVRARLLVFLGAVGLVLLLGCVNLTNLMLARTTTREHEMAVRRAIGASQGQLRRLLLLESMVLSLAGAAVGVLVATWGVRFFVAVSPPGIPRLAEVAVDWRVLLFALGLSGLTTIVIGSAPALAGGRADLAARLHSSRVARRGSAGALVIAETAIAVVLLAGAGLLGRTFVRLTAWDPGFDRQGLVVAWTSVSTGTFTTPAAVGALYRGALDAVRALPGVARASITSGGPLFGGEEPGMAHAAGARSDSTVVSWRDVGPDYFATIGISLRAGREFTAADRVGQPPVAVVNETAARRLWPGQPALGQRFTIAAMEGELTVVGVAADVPPLRPDAPVRPEVYWPYFQAPRWGAYVVARGRGGAAALAAPLRARLRDVSPELEPAQVTGYPTIVHRRIVSPRFNVLLLGGFASVAVLLAAVGITGLVAYRVNRRTREIGIRLALGAGPAAVVGRFLREGAVLVGVGTLLGVAGAAAVTRLLGTMLAGTSPTDPATFGVVIVGMLGIGLAATWMPARRASRVDPLEALRGEGE